MDANEFHRLARHQSGPGKAMMGVVGRGHDDQIDVVGRDQPIRISLPARFVAALRQAFGSRRRDAHDAEAARRLDQGSVNLGPGIAVADEADADDIAHDAGGHGDGRLAAPCPR